MQIMYGHVAHHFDDQGNHRLIVKKRLLDPTPEAFVSDDKGEWTGYTEIAKCQDYMGFSDYYGEKVIQFSELTQTKK